MDWKLEMCKQNVREPRRIYTIPFFSDITHYWQQSLEEQKKGIEGEGSGHVCVTYNSFFPSFLLFYHSRIVNKVPALELSIQKPSIYDSIEIFVLENCSLIYTD